MKRFSNFSYSYWLVAILICLFSYMGPVNAQSNSIRIGTATKIITPETPQWLQGAGIESEKVTEVYDDLHLEANGLYLSNRKTQILMVSCDLVGLQADYNTQLREAMGVAAGIPPRNVIISATHTHGGPSLIKSNYLTPLSRLYMKKLKEWLVDVAKKAVRSAQPGKIGWATGTARIGWNRRFTWTDGTHTMHGDATRSDFTGLEGPDDPQQTTLFAKDKSGKLLAIMYNNTTHPTTFYGDGVWSSDFPGYARKKLRQEFGKELPVLFLNGAEGDIQPSDPFEPRQETDEEEVQRLGNRIFKEVMDQYKQVTSYNDDPVLKHIYKDLKVGVRLPTPDRLAKARKVLARIDSGEDIRGMTMIMAFQAVQLQEKFGDAPFDILPIHGIRIGGLAIVTQPDELYSQFGLDIKRRSPVSTTMVVGLTDGSHGYIPTIYGIIGGGYTGKRASRSPFESYTGYRIVETGTLLLNQLWDDYENTDDKK